MKKNLEHVAWDEVNFKNVSKLDDRTDDLSLAFPEPGVSRIKAIGKYTVKCTAPYSHWTIFASEDGIIPELLSGNYTTEAELRKAIKLFEERKLISEKKHNETESH